MNATAKRQPGFTLVEMLFFGAVAAIVLVGAIGILGRGSRLLEVSRRSSGSQADLRVMLETMTEDTNELVYLEAPDNFDSSGGADSAFKFVIKSTRQEVGMETPLAASLRRVEYKLNSTGDPKLRECERTVTIVDGSGSGGATAKRVLARSVSRLRIWPIAAVQLPNRNYNLVAASDARARNPGATVACLVVDVTMGEAPSDRSVDQSAVTSVVTKLWCRNRVLEISRGGLQ